MEVRNNKMNITMATVLPEISEIYIDEHCGEYLVLNPLGPWWFVGSKLHANFVQLCDGKRSLKDINQHLLSSAYDRLPDEHIIKIAKSLIKANFFTTTVRKKINPLSVVFFNITKRCNLSCPYCYNDSLQMKSEKKGKELDSAVWIKLGSKISEINPHTKIIISGGEPLLRPDAVEIIEGLSKYNLAVKLVTNGTLFTKEIVSKLSSIDKLSVQVSIDSINPEVNAKTRGKEALEKAITAVKQLKEAEIDFEISATITRINNKTIRQFREYCDQNGYKFRSSIFMLSGERSKKNANFLELSQEEYLDAATYALEYYDPATTMGHPMLPGEPRCSCGMGYGQIDIGPDGSIYPCSHLCESKFYIGNIQTSDIQVLIEEGFNRFGSRNVDMMSYCNKIKCPVRYLCAGGCAANSLHNYGTLDVPPKNCNELKKTYFKSLWVSVLGSSYLKEKEPIK